MIIGNLRRREVRPLNPYFSPYSRRRYGADAQTNLNYRRTKDIRDKEDITDRRFEVNVDSHSFILRPEHFDEMFD